MPTRPQDSPFDRPRWTEQHAREVLDALARSGKSVARFAADLGLDPQRVYAWRRRLGGAEPTRFQELVVRGPAPFSVGADAPAFEIALATGEVVRVPASFDAAALARLLDVLVRARAC
ncbi:MAG TPA: transposase [Polyangiaceae bacterium]|jgi:transposase-like protein|nr:transposase [Polyangiaceae bacterium]